MSNDNIIYGWFDDPTQTDPTYEPPRDAPCLHCGKAVYAEDVRTHSLMYVGEMRDLEDRVQFEKKYAERRYFYRTHASCSDACGSTSVDGIVLDMIQRNGE